MNRKHFTICSCLHYFEFESHAHRMPTKYHLNGGGLCKYTECEWLLYALGGVETTPHVNPLWW